MINIMEETKLNFGKWFIDDKMQVFSFLFILLMTGIAVYTTLFEEAGWLMTGFFGVVNAVFIGKTIQSYNDYLKGRSR